MTTASLNNQGNVATRLLRAVLLKAGLEIGFVCLIATLAAFDNASPLLRGALDVVDRTQAAGWAFDPQAPATPLDVQLFIDDRFIATQSAAQARPDLVQAGAASDAAHGFRFDLTALPLTAGRHSAQVYAVREAAGKNKSLIPLNREPLMFEIVP
jgi:hypothetical protein